MLSPRAFQTALSPLFQLSRQIHVYSRTGLVVADKTVGMVSAFIDEPTKTESLQER